jgi:hypothetical protein
MDLELTQLEKIKNTRYSKLDADYLFIPKTEEVQVHSMVTEGANVTIDAKSRVSHSINVVANLTLTLAGFVAGSRSSVMIDVTNGGNFVITFAGGTTFNWIGIGGVFYASPSAAGVNLKIDGTSDFIILWSDDGGTNVFGKVMR